MNEPRRIYDPADAADYQAALARVADIQDDLEASRNGGDDRIALALCPRGNGNEQ